NITFPPGIFKNVHSYNADSLVKLHNLYGVFYSTKDSVIRRKTSDYILASCGVYKQDYISHNTFSYWVIKPIRDFKYLAIFSGTGYLPMPAFSQCSLLEKGIKLVFTVLYYIILICGFLGVLKLFLIKRN